MRARSANVRASAAAVATGTIVNECVRLIVVGSAYGSDSLKAESIAVYSACETWLSVTAALLMRKDVRPSPVCESSFQMAPLEPLESSRP